MKQYQELIIDVLVNGDKIDTERTGVGVTSVFGRQVEFDVSTSFPAMTTKRLPWKGVVSELLWFLKGSDDVNELRALLHGEENRYNLEKRTIWDANYEQQGVEELGYENGFAGDVYGANWRNFGRETFTYWDDHGADDIEHKINGIDQIRAVVDEFHIHPQSRRLMVSAWNPKVVWDYDDAGCKVNKPILPPCHYGFQLNIVGDDIDLLWDQRSVDVGLGLPYNIASYALLLCIFSRIINKKPRRLVGQLGNVHIYDNHLDGMHEVLSREPLDLSGLWINPNLKTLEDFENARVDDFKLINYNSHGTIKMEMAV